MEKMWALLVPLSESWTTPVQKAPLKFDDSVWDEIVKEASAAGINTIVFDLLDGICWGSYPELNLPGAWTRARLRKEIKRLKDLGIRAIPKLNFSAFHDSWLGEYGNMISTNTYYKVCRDLIYEAAELFEHPEYIHLGMDEEGIGVGNDVPDNRITIVRKGEAMWHDLRYLIDCVSDTGAKAWIWHDLFFDKPEEFSKHFSTEEIVISPWYYGGFKPEHYCAIADRQVTIDYYSQDKFKGMNLTYVEEDPWHTDVRGKMIPYAKYGYKYIPCGSWIQRCEYNYEDMIEYFTEGMEEEQIIGFFASAWRPVTEENKDEIVKNIRLFGKAKKKINS